jgi:hypothetical protein|tara:strand:- start:213 stop:377 length:165 start_codon:yes stop_codon:yes gene_type:complete
MKETVKDLLYFAWVIYVSLTAFIAVFAGENIFGMIFAWFILAFLLPLILMGDDF